MDHSQNSDPTRQTSSSHEGRSASESPEAERSQESQSESHGGERRRRRGHRGRKERVLHTRISEPLAEDIRRIADDLRVPVSNIVRNVLEEAFSFVETVTENVGDLVEEVVDEADRVRTRDRHHRHRHPRYRRRRHRSRPERDEPRRPRAEPPEFPDVVGWQPLVLNQGRSCADCSEPLERGDRAFAGLSAKGLSETYICPDCMDDRR